MSCLSTWSTAGGAVLQGCGTFQRQGLEEVGHWGRALRPASQSPLQFSPLPSGDSVWAAVPLLPQTGGQDKLFSHGVSSQAFGHRNRKSNNTNTSGKHHKLTTNICTYKLKIKNIRSNTELKTGLVLTKVSCTVKWFVWILKGCWDV